MTYRKLNNITISNVLDTCEDCTNDPIVRAAVDLEAYFAVKPHYLTSKGDPYKCTDEVEKESTSTIWAEKEAEGCYRIYVSTAYWLESLIGRAQSLLAVT